MAEQVSKVILCVTQIEGICEAISAFWQMQSDKFVSYSLTTETDKELLKYEFPAEKIAEDNIKSLLERKSQLEEYHKKMTTINSSFNFPTSLTPSEFPSITLETLNMTLQWTELWSIYTAAVTNISLELCTFCAHIVLDDVHVEKFLITVPSEKKNILCNWYSSI